VANAPQSQSHSEERFSNGEAFPSNFTGMNPTLLKGVMSTSERSSCCGCLIVDCNDNYLKRKILKTSQKPKPK
jgi:hypothetical protein